MTRPAASDHPASRTPVGPQSGTKSSFFEINVPHRRSGASQGSFRRAARSSPAAAGLNGIAAN